MTRNSSDLAIGIVVGLTLLAGVSVFAGVGGLLYVLYLIGYGSIVLHLWRGNSRPKKLLAVIMMPIILISLIPGVTTKTLHKISGLEKSGDQSTTPEPK
jgi:hypothetical protein